MYYISWLFIRYENHNDDQDGVHQYYSQPLRFNTGNPEVSLIFSLSRLSLLSVTICHPLEDNHNDGWTLDNVVSGDRFQRDGIAARHQVQSPGRWTTSLLHHQHFFLAKSSWVVVTIFAPKVFLGLLMIVNFGWSWYFTEQMMMLTMDLLMLVAIWWLTKMKKAYGANPVNGTPGTNRAGPSSTKWIKIIRLQTFDGG